MGCLEYLDDNLRATPIKVVDVEYHSVNHIIEADEAVRRGTHIIVGYHCAGDGLKISSH